MDKLRRTLSHLFNKFSQVPAVREKLLGFSSWLGTHRNDTVLPPVAHNREEGAYPVWWCWYHCCTTQGNYNAICLLSHWLGGHFLSPCLCPYQVIQHPSLFAANSLWLGLTMPRNVEGQAVHQVKYPCSRRLFCCLHSCHFFPLGPNESCSFCLSEKEFLSSSSHVSFCYLNHDFPFSHFFPHVWELPNLRDSACMHAKTWDSTSTTGLEKFSKSVFCFIFGLGEKDGPKESRRWGKHPRKNEVSASKIDPWHPCDNW